MVKYIFLLLFATTFFSCLTSRLEKDIAKLNLTQHNKLSKALAMNAKFSKDTVSFGDTISITLKYTNISNDTVCFSEIGNIHMDHNIHSVFITYCEIEKIVYWLNLGSSREFSVKIPPNQFFVKEYPIVITRFFSTGLNTQIVCYGLRKLTEKELKMLKKKYNYTILNESLCGGLCSPVVSLYVK